MSKTILIIEDDLFLQELEASKLKKAGYEVKQAKDSIEADEIFKSGVQIDLILLDLMLPGLDGFAILKKVRDDESTKHIPTIIFSNLSEDGDIQRAEDLGISEFLLKSNFSLNDLAHKIKSVIGE